jgi:hypothetical protein
MRHIAARQNVAPQNWAGKGQGFRTKKNGIPKT